MSLPGAFRVGIFSPIPIQSRLPAHPWKSFSETPAEITRRLIPYPQGRFLFWTKDKG